MMKRVAFIGAGSMGSRMARRVIAGGFEVMICDPDRGVRGSFEKDGVKVTTRAADTAQADVVIVLVASDAQIEGALFGEQGVTTGISGAPPIVAIMSTTLPDTVRSIASRIGSHGVHIVDAPVSGGPVGAEQGTLSILAAGSTADIDHVEPVFRCMGRNIFRCGALGAGQAVKLVNNMIAIANIYAVNEAYTLAEKAGLDLDVLQPVLEVSTGRTFLSKDMDAARKQYATWAADRRAFDATTKITGKDMTLVAKLAASNGLDLPALNAVLRLTEDTSQGLFERWQRFGKVG